MAELTAHLFRENSGKMLAVLSRMFGLSKIDFVMDVVQDTFETALIKWKFSGVPDNPSGWLMQVAKNKALNVFKRESKSKSFSPSVYLSHFESGMEAQFNILLSPKEIKDSQLRLLFACCHPDFATKNQIMITLNILCGFGVPEIASALMMNDEAVKKALTRSKAQLKRLDTILEAHIITQSGERMKTVQTILYLMFNEGYKTTRSHEAINNGLCFEASDWPNFWRTKTVKQMRCWPLCFSICRAFRPGLVPKANGLRSKSKTEANGIKYLSKRDIITLIESLEKIN